MLTTGADPDANESGSIPIQPEQTLLFTYHPNYIKTLPVIDQTYLAHNLWSRTDENP